MVPEVGELVVEALGQAVISPLLVGGIIVLLDEHLRRGAYLSSIPLDAPFVDLRLGQSGFEVLRCLNVLHVGSLGGGHGSLLRQIDVGALHVSEVLLILEMGQLDVGLPVLPPVVLVHLGGGDAVGQDGSLRLSVAWLGDWLVA